MTKLDRLFQRPKSVLMYAFTGLVVVSTLVTLFQTLPPASDSTTKDSKNEKSKENGNNKKITDWSRVQLFEYLAQHQVYPEVETSRDELEKLVRNVMLETAGV